MAKRTKKSKRDDKGWQRWWDARLSALEKLFGKAEGDVMHSMIPLPMGGAADVLRFRPKGMGITYVTADLIGDSGQPKTKLGQYELMICQRDEKQEWAANLISRLAAYTLERPLEPWDTMSVAGALPRKSKISSLLFVPYAEFSVLRRKCGVLLCLGLTDSELRYCYSNDCDPVIAELKKAREFPFTDLRRRSVI